MKIRYERPVCYTAFWSHRLGLFALVLFAISAGLHRFGIMETEIFAVLFAICAGLSLLAFVMAAYGILRLWMVGRGRRSRIRQGQPLCPSGADPCGHCRLSRSDASAAL